MYERDYEFVCFLRKVGEDGKVQTRFLCDSDIIYRLIEEEGYDIIVARCNEERTISNSFLRSIANLHSQLGDMYFCSRIEYESLKRLANTYV